MNKIVKILFGLAATAAAAFGLNELDKRFHYYADGYNRYGFNREGFDHDGFNASGYDKDGYDRKGYDKDGYNREGLNAEGFNKRGYNKAGRDKYGYDVYGFDCNGYNRSGFDRNGYNPNGEDRSGHTRMYYQQKIAEMEANSCSAHEQMKLEHFEYALRDIRVGLEKGIKAILAHTLGKGYEDNKLKYNIEVCSRHRIFEEEFVKKLEGAKKHCNDTAHEDYEKDYGQVHFCYKVLEELTEILKGVVHIED